MPFETAALVGAGVAGLACAQALRTAGVDVTVYEKSRGPGGRTASRREGALRFDHGAQVLEPGALAGTPVATVTPWTPRRTGDLPGATAVGDVPVPAMSALTRALAEGLVVRPGVEVAPLAPRAEGGVALRTTGGEALPHADRVVVAAPAPQAAVLMAPVAPGLARAAASVTFAPCWTAMVAWAEPLGLALDLHDAPDEDLAWAAAQASRPGRDPGERWVLQASAAWSSAHLEDPAGRVALALLDHFAGTVGATVDLPQPALLTAHRWRYSEPVTPLEARHLLAGPVAAAGDWCGGGRVAGAIASGRAAAAALLAA